MREPKLDWPNKANTSTFLKATGLTKSEVEQEVRASISTAELMARAGVAHLDKVLSGPKADWPEAWLADEMLVQWFGAVKKPNQAADVQRRLERVHGRLESKVITVRLRHEFAKCSRHAQHIGWFVWPKSFQVAPKWFTFDKKLRGGITIHELLHEWFADQKFNGKTVYGTELASALALSSPRDARQSPENYEHYCLEGFKFL